MYLHPCLKILTEQLEICATKCGSETLNTSNNIFKMTDESSRPHVELTQDATDDLVQSAIPVAVIMSMKDNAHCLTSVIQKFAELKLPVDHLETRPGRVEDATVPGQNGLDLYVQTVATPLQVRELEKNLHEFDSAVKVIEEVRPIDSVPSECPRNKTTAQIPWFPRHISELDKVSNHVLMYGSELDADHPGFKDAEYRKRRNMFAEIAYNYKHGQPIPRIEYTEAEKKTWGTIYRELTKLYETHACKQHIENLKLLQQHAGYCESDLPQLDDISNFLKTRTGFTVRPVAGYLSARDFLSGLAFRVFYCTQYIRHPSDPMYTPEPDCCHELLGHMPMLADPTFARFSHEIGLASLGAPDEEVKKLATCYFFTIEFGLCRQDGSLRAYGAGLLSSIAELKHALSDKANVKPFLPNEVMNEECMVTTFQNGYFETPSFEDATEKMRQFARTISRPFDVIYDPYTQTVEVVDSLEKLGSLVGDMKNEMLFLGHALDKLRKYYEE